MIKQKSNFLNDAQIILIIVNFAIQLYRLVKNHDGLYWSRN